MPFSVMNCWRKKPSLHKNKPARSSDPTGGQIFRILLPRGKLSWEATNLPAFYYTRRARPRQTRCCKKRLFHSIIHISFI